jgi:hypothetical protein
VFERGTIKQYLDVLTTFPSGNCFRLHQATMPPSQQDASVTGDASYRADEHADEDMHDPNAAVQLNRTAQTLGVQDDQQQQQQQQQQVETPAHASANASAMREVTPRHTETTRSTSPSKLVDAPMASRTRQAIVVRSAILPKAKANKKGKPSETGGRRTLSSSAPQKAACHAMQSLSNVQASRSLAKRDATKLLQQRAQLQEIVRQQETDLSAAMHSIEVLQRAVECKGSNASSLVRLAESEQRVHDLSIALAEKTHEARRSSLTLTRVQGSLDSCRLDILARQKVYDTQQAFLKDCEAQVGRLKAEVGR